MDAVKSAWTRMSANKEQLVWNVWRFTLVWVGCFVISAIALAASNDTGEKGTSRSDGFAAIWTMLLIVALSVGGTMVLRKHRKPLAVGFFLGVCVMMSVNMFTENWKIYVCGLSPRKCLRRH